MSEDGRLVMPTPVTMCRGRRSDTGEMISGMISLHERLDSIGIYGVHHGRGKVWCGSLYDLNDYAYDVDKGTIGMYTGFSSASGLAIFGGDIIRVQRFRNEDHSLVHWDDLDSFWNCVSVSKKTTRGSLWEVDDASNHNSLSAIVFGYQDKITLVDNYYGPIGGIT